MKKFRLGVIFSASILSLGLISLSSIKNNNELLKTSAIDINDYSACETAHHNNNATALLTALRKITSPGHSGSYDGLYETYKSAYLKPNGKIFDYYSSITNYDPDKDRAGSYKKEGDCFNREHSIPQSWWGGGTSNQGSDPFIVVPTDGYVNNARSNDPFGFVKSASKTFSNSKSGSADTTWGYTGTVFEPDDSVKGDFARIYFYAIAKYSAASGWSSGNAKTCFSGSDTNQGGLTSYAIKLFSYWSNLDPVSEWEMHANDAIAPIQGNRNPFIDHPEYANTMWGSYSGYTQYTHGTPSSDGISISKDRVFLISNDTTTISATSTDASAISWSTSDSNVVRLGATVSASGTEITLTGKNAGTATVTASATIDGETYSQECEVEVAATKQVVSVVISNAKTVYSVGSEFVKPTVTATYNDGTTADVTSSATCTGYDMSTAGKYTVTVSYSFGGATKTTTYEITVKDSGGGEPGEEVTLDIDFLNNKSSDEDSLGNVWSASGNFTPQSGYLLLNANDTYISNSPALSVDTSSSMTITAKLRTHGGGNTQSLKFTAYNEYNEPISDTLVLSPEDKNLKPYSGTLNFNSSDFHEITIKATAAGISGTYKIAISEMSVSYTSWNESPKLLEEIDISVSPRTQYYVGNYFDPSNLVITRSFDDGSSDTYAYDGHESEFSFNPSTSTPLTVDYDDVEIMYGGQSCFIPIEVSVPLELTAITLSGDYQTSFVEGDEFVFGGTVTAHYSNLSTKDVTSEATFDYDLTEVGEQTVIVNYGGLTNNYDIVVTAGTLSSISVSEMTTTFVKNSPFVFDGICTAVFENGYEKEVTPTSVSSPDMSSTGVKEVSVTYSYNEKTVTTSYNITVNAYRDVYEAEDVNATLTWDSDKTPHISPSDLGLSSSLSGNTYYESGDSAIRLGTGSGGGTIKITTATSKIKSIVINAKYYNKYSSAVLKCNGQSVGTLTSSFKEFEVKINSKNDITVLTESKENRVVIKYIQIVVEGELVNIGQTEDCIGLEAFITEYMHMGYVDNLGYCKDSEHHYYQTAKEEFNKLNDHQRELFTSNEAYLAEWTRLETWAKFNNDSLNESTNKLEAHGAKLDSYLEVNNQMMVIVISVASTSAILLAMLLVIKKRKKH